MLTRESSPSPGTPTTTAPSHRWPWTLAAMATGGVLFYLGTGFAPIAALTWLAPLPALLIAPRVPAAAAAAAGFGGYFLGTANNWAFSVDSVDLPLPVNMTINVGCGAVFTAGVLLFRALARGGRPLAAAAAPASVWTTAMYIVVLVNPQGLIDPLGTPQADYPLVAQLASVTGGWGVAFAVLFVPAAVAAAVEVRTARWRPIAGAALAIAIVLTVGLVRPGGESGPDRRVALIASNHSGWGVDLATAEGKALVDAYAGEVSALPDDVTMAVLPEGAFSSDETSLAGLTGPMTKLAADRGIEIVVGVVHHPAGGIEQSAFTFHADGAEPTVYLKHYDRSTHVPGDELVFPVDGDPYVGVQICGDLTHPDLSREYAAAGARFLAIPASTEGDNGRQMARVAMYRGIENGLAVAWSGRDGDLMVADAYGRVAAEAHTGPSGEFTTVVAAVGDGPGATVYTRFGDWFAWAATALALGLVVAAVARRAGRG